MPATVPALAAEVRGAADHLALVADLLGLVEVDAQPGGEQVEDVARRVVGVEVRGQRVEHGDDRVQQLLQAADEAHPEVALLVDGRQAAAQVGAAGGDGRRRPSGRPTAAPSWCRSRRP